MNRIELIKVNAVHIAALAGAVSLESISKLATIGLCISGIAYNIFKIRSERNNRKP